MALFWGQDILPVSPMLIALLLEDFDAAIDKSFLQAVTPDMAARFATWPPRRVPVAGSATGQTMFDVNIREDPMSLILEHVPATQVSPGIYLCYGVLTPVIRFRISEWCRKKALTT